MAADDDELRVAGLFEDQLGRIGLLDDGAQLQIRALLAPAGEIFRHQDGLFFFDDGSVHHRQGSRALRDFAGAPAVHREERYVEERGELDSRGDGE